MLKFATMFFTLTPERLTRVPRAGASRFRGERCNRAVGCLFSALIFIENSLVALPEGLPRDHREMKWSIYLTANASTLATMDARRRQLL